MEDKKARKDSGFTYLMQITDGSRIDMTLIPIDHIAEMEENSLSLLLLDKDDLFDHFPPRPSKPILIAAMNSGGWRLMSPKARLGMRSSTQSTFWT